MRCISPVCPTPRHPPYSAVFPVSVVSCHLRVPWSVTSRCRFFSHVINARATRPAPPWHSHCFVPVAFRNYLPGFPGFCHPGATGCSMARGQLVPALFGSDQRPFCASGDPMELPLSCARVCHLLYPAVCLTFGGCLSFPLGGIRMPSAHLVPLLCQ